MQQDSTKMDANGTALFAGDAWFNPIEAGIRDRVRGFIEELILPRFGGHGGSSTCRVRPADPGRFRAVTACPLNEP